MPRRTQIGRQILHVLGMAMLGLVLNLAAWAQAKPSIPPHGKLMPLFNGKDFTGFDTLLEKQGINSDPNKVFQVEKGVLHISGQEFGGLVTHKEYANYYLRAQFKWGEKTYPPRDGKARDSGIQYNITGPLRVWPRMMEFQINEGGTGDMWVVGGTGVTVDGKLYESTSSGPGAYIRIPHIGRGPLVNVAGYRDPANDLEKPHGEWNVLELVVDHDRTPSVCAAIARESAQMVEQLYVIDNKDSVLTGARLCCSIRTAVVSNVDRLGSARVEEI